MRRSDRRTAARPTPASSAETGATVVVGGGEHTYEAIHDWGELPASIRYGNTHGVCEDSQGRIRLPHRPRDEREPRRDGRLRRGREVRRLVGRRVRRRCARPPRRARGRRGVPLPHGHLAGPGGEDDARRGRSAPARLSARLRALRRRDAVQPDERRPRAERRPLRCRRLRLELRQPVDRAGTFIGSFGGVGSEPGRLDGPHDIVVDLRRGEPVLTVADRTNRRLQHFTLDGEHLGFSGGVDLPCHFDQQDGLLVVPDLAARVTLLGLDNHVVVHLGQGADDWKERRKLGREHFVPGAFVCPHSACFDREGNVFVVEWVEVGRVMKLRRV